MVGSTVAEHPDILQAYESIVPLALTTQWHPERTTQSDAGHFAAA